MRSAVMVCVFCLGILLRRPAMTANSFALGWLVVAALNPTDVFGSGCLLSFLAVAVLYWGTARWFQASQDPLERLVEEARPLWQKVLRRVVRQILLSYAVTLAVWLAVAPLVAGRFHLVSPVAVLIGPPVVFFTTIALLSGFLLLLVAAVCGPIVPLFAGLVQGSLAVCDFVIHRGQQLPFAYWYVSDIPDWWLWGFYLGLLTWLTVERLRGFRWMSYSALLIWIIVGAIGFWLPRSTDNFRCTFLAVGHGGCTVLETPDGRVLLYDAGAMTGPDVTRRQIAPFLWQRGLRRVDEVFLSHADIDHFNGLNALVERFSVGQVTCTPTFAEKKIPGVPETLNFLQKKQIPIRIVRAGDRLAAGPVLLDVLHPPEIGPDGKENFRSLVIHVRYGDHALLLTGDLEGPGLERVLTLPLPKVDVLMAPHHGSRAGDLREVNNRTRLAIQTQPRVIVSCQGLPKSSPNKPDPYAASGARFFGTWPHGAITIRSGPNGLVIETFQSRDRLEF
jgi:competence protein ComEC